MFAIMNENKGINMNEQTIIVLSSSNQSWLLYQYACHQQYSSDEQDVTSRKNHKLLSK